MGRENGNDQPPQGLGSSLSAPNWQDGVNRFWNNFRTPHSNDAGRSKAPSTDDTIQNGASSSILSLSGPNPNGASSGRHPLTPAHDNDHWPQRHGVDSWTTAASPHNTSGSTSPNRTRDNAVHDPSSSHHYTQVSFHPSANQRASISARRNPATSFDFDSAADTLGHTAFSAANQTGGNGGAFTSSPTHRGLGLNRHNSSDEDHFLGRTTVPGDPMFIPPPSNSSSDQQARGPLFRDSTYAGPSASPNTTHAHRPSLAGLTTPFPNHPSAGSRAFIRDQLEEAQLSHAFSRNLSLNGGSNSTHNDTFYNTRTLHNVHNNGARLGPGGASPAYGPGAAPPFHIDHTSQPLNNGNGLTDLSLPSHNNAFINSFSNGYVNAWPAPQDRNPPLANGYTQNGDIALDEYNEPPIHHTLNLAPGLSSRDVRMPTDVERRPQALPLTPHTPAFYPPAYMNRTHQNQPPQFPTNIYEQIDPSIVVHTTITRALQQCGLNVPFPEPTGNPPPQGTNRDQDASRRVMSKLLKEYDDYARYGIGSKDRRWELKDIVGHFVEFGGDQLGSRLIQSKLTTANSDDKERVFREIEPNSAQLMKDVYGNYVIQKFFEHGSQAQKTVLANDMRGQIFDLSTGKYACRVVQKALEHILVDQQAELVREMEHEVLKIIKGEHGNHVIQKVIEIVPRRFIGFIMDAFRGRVSELSTDQFACRVVQRALEHGTDADRAMIMDEIHSCSQILITDTYGNYVAQHVIQNAREEDRAKMIRLVTKQIVMFSKHKFASNVVEKCIEFGSREQRQNIRKAFTTPGNDGRVPLPALMKDQYANYVIQKLLNNLEGADRMSFIEEMKPLLPSLRRTSTGRQISAIDRLINAIESPAPTNKDTPASGRTSASRRTSASGRTSGSRRTPTSTEPTSPASQVDAGSQL